MTQEKDLEFVREQLRKAADVKDPRDMWFVVRDILGLLTLMIVPASEGSVALDSSLDGQLNEK